MTIDKSTRTWLKPWSLTYFTFSLLWVICWLCLMRYPWPTRYSINFTLIGIARGAIPQLSIIFCRYVLWESVTQTKNCCSLVVKKIWSRKAFGLATLQFTLCQLSCSASMDSSSLTYRHSLTTGALTTGVKSFHRQIVVKVTYRDFWCELRLWKRMWILTQEIYDLNDGFDLIVLLNMEGVQLWWAIALLGNSAKPSSLCKIKSN